MAPTGQMSAALFGGPHHMVWDLPQPGTELVPPALEARRSNHWTTGEIQKKRLIFKFCHSHWSNSINDN